VEFLVCLDQIARDLERCSVEMESPTKSGHGATTFHSSPVEAPPASLHLLFQAVHLPINAQD
jgi:hypothetical protein